MINGLFNYQCDQSLETRFLLQKIRFITSNLTTINLVSLYLIPEKSILSGRGKRPFTPTSVFDFTQNNYTINLASVLIQNLRLFPKVGDLTPLKMSCSLLFNLWHFIQNPRLFQKVGDLTPLKM